MHQGTCIDRYGFNGKERDNNIGIDVYDYGMRISDSRTGRFFSVDPLTAKYPELSTYQFGSNRPIDGVEQDGLEHTPAGKYGIYGETVVDATATARYNYHPVLLRQAVDDAPRRVQEQKRAAMRKEVSRMAHSRSNAVIKPTPVPMGSYEAEQWKASSERQFEAAGYNADGSPTPLTRLGENKTWNNFANNLALPAVKFYVAVEGGAAIKGGESLFGINKVFTVEGFRSFAIGAGSDLISQKLTGDGDINWVSSLSYGIFKSPLTGSFFASTFSYNSSGFKIENDPHNIVLGTTLGAVMGNIGNGVNGRITINAASTPVSQGATKTVSEVIVNSFSGSAATKMQQAINKATSYSGN